ncbi:MULTISPECIES: diacylglycerol kinase family protein [Planococcaceae]|uniref:Diacylglycerol kinase family protein n=1 Tax=Planococcus halotolerans TaxID=2233542 RepID=A0A365KUH3_9BACL|nr:MULTISPECIES: diacylglycerol kinase family protein [Planococcaceae]QHJ71504.1 diacylglycerol kinase family protein [Planococcus halotolerans]RAZ76819.1 diacylglycerol kinase family protein [Planococcus halotolerans]RLQ92253.1 diacylglycerol kinase family protein [Planomicrobium sp. Y74]
MKAIRFFRSFVFAFAGIRAALKSEQNIRFHFTAAVIVLIAGLLTGLSAFEWMIIVLVIGGMLAFEMFNSSMERIVDLASPDLHPLAKQAKDMAAGAVLVFAIASAIIGLLIFLPKWF